MVAKNFPRADESVCTATLLASASTRLSKAVLFFRPGVNASSSACLRRLSRSILRILATSPCGISDSNCCSGQGEDVCSASWSSSPSSSSSSSLSSPASSSALLLLSSTRVAETFSPGSWSSFCAASFSAAAAMASADAVAWSSAPASKEPPPARNAGPRPGCCSSSGNSKRLCGTALSAAPPPGSGASARISAVARLTSRWCRCRRTCAVMAAAPSAAGACSITHNRKKHMRDIAATDVGNGPHLF
mmetsp:Transcript_16307/g.44665  ORF Transcript_16307/g.44665 Transcript_16307/m.44665 type:complete len:247 (+) Transcript_16307:303-1043(+)